MFLYDDNRNANSNPDFNKGRRPDLKNVNFISCNEEANLQIILCSSIHTGSSLKVSYQTYKTGTKYKMVYISMYFPVAGLNADRLVIYHRDHSVCMRRWSSAGVSSPVELRGQGWVWKTFVPKPLNSRVKVSPPIFIYIYIYIYMYTYIYIYKHIYFYMFIYRKTKENTQYWSRTQEFHVRQSSAKRISNVSISIAEDDHK